MPPPPLEPKYRARVRAALHETQALLETLQQMLEGQGGDEIANMQIDNIKRFLERG